MTESNQNISKNTLLKVLVIALLIFSAIQTWYLLGMKQQLDSLQNQQSTAQPDEHTLDMASATQTEALEATAEATASIETTETEAPASEPQEKQAVDSSPETQPEAMSRAESNKQPEPDPFYNNNFYADRYDSFFRDPYAEIERMRREMDQEMERLFNSSRRHFNDQQYSNRYPNDQRNYSYHFKQDFSLPEIDMRENRKEYIVKVNLPGADKNDISVTLDGQRLIISGKRDYQEKNRDPDGNFVFTQRSSGKFRRSITLTEPVTEKGMKTGIDNGILTIVIPKIT